MKTSRSLLTKRLGLLVAVMLAGQANAYDYDTARVKLLQIGRALQLYRAEQTVKPVAERKTFKDCGLPDSLTRLCRPGHSWSLPSDRSTFRVPTPLFRGQDTNFNKMYWDAPAIIDRFGSMSHFYALRGERLPILADFNMNSADDFRNDGTPIKALILRLDGTVDLVTFRSGHDLELLEK